MSLMKIVASNSWNIDFTWANKSLHCVDDGSGNYVRQKNIWHETMFQYTNICTKKNNGYIMKWLLHNLYPSLKLIYTLIYDQCFPCVLKSGPNMFKVLHTYAWISITRSEICFPINIAMIEYNIRHVEFIIKTFKTQKFV